MSYILDALRRADAERERGHVPGIHDQPTRVAIPAHGVVRTAVRPWLWGGLAVLLLVVGGLIWRLQSGDGNAAVEVAASSPSVPAAVLPTPTSPVTTAPVIAAPVPTVTPTPIRKQAPPIVPPASKAATTVRPAAPASAVVDPSDKVYAPEELPDDVRRDLPKLAIGGSIYSASPASRFVIVNGQLLHEGDALSPGLVLQQIKLKSAILSFRGYRYRLNF